MVGGEVAAQAERGATAPAMAGALRVFAATVENRAHLFRHLALLAGEERPEGLLPISSLAAAFAAHPRAARAASRLAGVMAPVILSACVLAGALSAVAAKLFHGGARAPLPERLVIATSYRVAELALRLPAAERPSAWLLVPGIKLQSALVARIPGGDARVQLWSQASWGDLAWAIGAHWRAAWMQGIGGAERVLAANALPWFLLWRVLARSGGGTREWWFGNHYDQWALLIDAVPVSARRLMLQHGIESEDGGPHSFPNRLRRLDVLYCYGPDQEQFFRDHVLAHPERVEVRTVPVSIRLEEMVPARPGVHRVLLIGSPAECEREGELVAALVRRGDVQVLVKPHPLFAAGRYEAMRGERVLVLGDRGRFPVVDLALSPLSTLGMEYAASGVPVVWHSGRAMEAVLAEVGERLSALDPTRLQGMIAAGARPHAAT